MSSLRPADRFLGATIGGKYTISRQIGVGGMGAVYLARQSTLNRDVAIKFLQVGGQITPDLVQRFEQEARIVAGLLHPNIVTIFDYGLWEGTPYMVMEYVDGVTLADRLDRGGPLPLTETLRITRQVLDALAEAHGRHIIHRDLKPANLMLVTRGLSHSLVKVLDFGIARIVNDTNEQGEEGRITRTGLIMGSPKTISPEQISGEQADGRSDLYSLGVILYYMLSGHYPFVGPTPMAILFKHHHDPPPPLPIDQCPLGLRPILERSLAKHPAERYQTAGEMAADLDRFFNATTGSQALLPALASASASWNRPVALQPPRPRSSLWIWLLLGILLVLLGITAGGAWFVFNLPSRPAPVVVTAPTPRPQPALERPPVPPPVRQDVRLRLRTTPEQLEVLVREATAPEQEELQGRTPLELTFPPTAFPLQVRFRQGATLTESRQVVRPTGEEEALLEVDLREELAALNRPVSDTRPLARPTPVRTRPTAPPILPTPPASPSAATTAPAPVSVPPETARTPTTKGATVPSVDDHAPRPVPTVDEHEPRAPGHVPAVE